MLDAIKLHVDAKRYLCHADVEYHERLSEDSKRSLALQGGVFDADAAARFIALPAARDAVPASPMGRPRQAGRPGDAAARPLPRPRGRLRPAGAALMPPLSWTIVGAVLFGALLHASWNALIKSGPDKALDTALIHVLGCGVGAILLLVVGLPRREALPWIAASLVIHVGYYVTLVGAYRYGELGFAYPLMRGSAPLLVALASGRLLGEHVPLAAWIGVAGISGGVLAIGLTRSARDSGSRRHALAYALTNAVIIATYTIVDGIGVRVSGDALQYVGLLFLLDGLPYFALVLWQRRTMLVPTVAYMRARWPVALLGACASLGAYGIALWAMTRAPVASVAALRETSVLFAALIGVFVLNERFRLQRAVGTGAIIAGVMALRLA